MRVGLTFAAAMRRTVLTTSMNVGTFLGIFALIFVLELPDKTMIATIVMSTRARPSSIVIGASAGFVLQMGIAVGAGGLLTLLPAHVKGRRRRRALPRWRGVPVLLPESAAEAKASARRDERAARQRAGARS